MLFAIYARDRIDAGDLRKNTRVKHLSYLENAPLVFAGPLLNEENEMCGSLIVLEMENLREVEKFSSNDPYSKAGLFKSVEITRFKKAFPKKVRCEN